jgi:hypothetical protein
MSMTNEQLAELLAGIARSQQAIIDAIESGSGGWRSTHLLPKLNTAANMRIANVRLLDLPSRILLRSQARVPMDVATIARDLALAMGAESVAAPAASATTTPKTAATSSTPAPAAAAAPATNPNPAPAAKSATDDEELNFFDN